jgi:hypothetical protein
MVVPLDGGAAIVNLLHMAGEQVSPSGGDENHLCQLVLRVVVGSQGGGGELAPVGSG